MGISGRLHILKASVVVQITFSHSPMVARGWVNSELELSSGTEVPVLSQPCYGQCWRVVVGRASCSREIPALECCILLLVFTDTLVEDVITCS